MFNWFSLDYIYYPVSGIMWLWYKLFGLFLGPANFFFLGAVGDVPGLHPACIAL